MRFTVALVCLVVLGACADDDDAADSESASTEAPAAVPSESEPASSSSTSPPTTTPATTSPASAAPATTAAASTLPESSGDPELVPPTSPTTPGSVAMPTEAERAEMGLLQLGEFPEGWTHEPYDPLEDASNPERLAQIGECAGVDPGLLGAAVLGDTAARSGDFSSPDGLASVSQTIGFAHDEATAQQAMEAIADPDIASCYEDVYREIFGTSSGSTEPSDTMPPGMVFVDIAMEPGNRLEFITDNPDAVWYGVTMSTEYNGEPLELYLDLLFMREGKALSNIEFNGVGAPFPVDQDPPDLIARNAWMRLKTIG